MDEIVKANIHKRNRHSDCFQEDSNEPKEGCCSSMLQQPKNEMEISEFSAKKPRGDVRLSSEAVLEDSSTMQSSKRYSTIHILRKHLYSTELNTYLFPKTCFLSKQQNFFLNITF